MNCKKVTRLTSEYIDNRLSVTLTSEVDAHIAACPVCAAAVDGMRKMVCAMKSLSGNASPVDCWSGVYERIERRESARAKWLQWLMRPVVAAPAVGLASLLTVIVMWPGPVREPVGQRAAVQGYDHLISAHSRLQRQQVFADPDVAFIAAELDKTETSGGLTRP